MGTEHLVTPVAGLVVQLAHIKGVVKGVGEVVVAAVEYIGGLGQLGFVGDQGLLQELADRLDRDCRNAGVDGLGADARRQLDRLQAGFDTAAQFASAVEHDALAAVDVDDGQFVTGVDQVRVLDLRVLVPDLRPVPGVAQEAGGDVPKGVALLHDVDLGVLRFVDDVLGRGFLLGWHRDDFGRRLGLGLFDRLVFRQNHCIGFLVAGAAGKQDQSGEKPSLYRKALRSARA